MAIFTYASLSNSYHIIPAGKPDAVSNCSILNQTFDSLFVSCVEGFNGGLQQSFVIEIWDFHSQHVIRNLTNHRPVFNVRGLEPGASYIVRVYAVNSKGRSEVQVIQASTLKAAEKQTGYSAGYLILYFSSSAFFICCNCLLALSKCFELQMLTALSFQLKLKN